MPKSAFLILGQSRNVVTSKRCHNRSQLLPRAANIRGIQAADTVPPKEASRGLSLAEYVNLKPQIDLNTSVYAIVQFIAQLLLTAYYLALLVERDYPSLAQLAHSTYSYTIGTLSLSGPVALFAMR